MLIAAFALVIGGACSAALFRWYLSFSHARTVSHLTTTKAQLITEMYGFFADNIAHAAALLGQEKLRNQLELRQPITDLIPTNTAWLDVLFVDAKGTVQYSLRNEIPVGTQTATIPALERMRFDTEYLLSDWIGEFALMPGTNKPLLFAVFPCVHNKKYLGMLVTVLDHALLQNMISKYASQLGPNGDIIIGRENKVSDLSPDYGTVLFATKKNPKSAFTEVYSLQAKSPIAFATTNNFENSIDTYGKKLIASARDFLITLRWALAVVEDITASTRILKLLIAISFLVALLGVVLLLVWVALNLRYAAHLIWEWKHFVSLLVIAIGLLGSWYLFFEHLDRFRISSLQAQKSAIAEAKSDIQYAAALFVQESYLLQTAVDTAARAMQRGHNEIDQLTRELSPGAVLGISKQANGKWSNAYSLNTTHTVIHESVPSIDWQGGKKATSFWKAPESQKIYGKDIFIVYAKPIQDGYVWGGFTFDHIKSTLSALGPDRLKQTIIFGATGLTIYHENRDYVRHGAKAKDILQNIESVFSAILQRGSEGHSGITEPFRNSQGLERILYVSIPGPQWTLMIAYPEKEFHNFRHEQYILFAQASILFLFFLLFLVAFLVRITDWTLLSIQAFSPWATALFVCGTIVIILASYRQYDTQHVESVINSPADAARVQSAAESISGKKFTVLRMGLNVTHLEILNPNKINFAARVWQTIDRKKYPHAKFGFTVLNATEPVKIQQIHSKTLGDVETVQWEVRGTIFQLNPTYATVPFDNQLIGIQLAPVDPDSIILVPDISAYTTMKATAKPGIIPGFTMKDHVIIKSYFNNTGSQAGPILTFTLLIKRNLLSLFLQYVLPLLVILLTIYMLSLLVVTESVTKVRISIITALSGLFFGIILLHQNYRTVFVIPGISYLEWIIAGVYACLGLSYLNALFLLENAKSRPYKATLFWPILMAYIFIVTVATFV